MPPEPNLEFEGKTYVVFSDLSGFKQMLESVDEAHKALDSFYNTIYTLLEKHQYLHIAGLAVADCSICWLKYDDERNRQRLYELTKYLKEFHEKMLKEGYLISSTIAWGPFKYESRIRLENLDKQMFYGKPYVQAYLSNSKVEPGAIVLLKDGCEINPKENSELKKFFRKYKEPDGWEYFWSIKNVKDIKMIIEERQKARNLRFERLKDIYKGKCSIESDLAEERD